MTPRLLTLSLVLIAAAVSPAQTAWRPAKDDVMEVYRHSFSPENWSRGRAVLLDRLKSILNRDGLVRSHLVAENPSTREIVTVAISDPSQVGRGKVSRGLTDVYRLSRKPRDRHEYRIFATCDEGVTPRVGDSLFLYWRLFEPDAHAEAKSAFESTMMRALATDGRRRNAVFGENDRSGDFLAIGYGQPAKGRQLSDRAAMGSVTDRYIISRIVEAFRIIYVYSER